MPTLHERLPRAALDGMLDQIDVGSTDTTGDLRLLDAGSAELVTFPLSNPAFAASTTVSPGVAEAQANAVASDSTVTAGTFTGIEIRDRDNVVLYAGSVGMPGSGADLIVTDNVIPGGTTSASCPAFSCALVLVG
jgi:hypothetical protein